ncbi:6-phosphogluconolactonase [Segnochrobactraceae bacterium EtOH-i3]
MTAPLARHSFPQGAALAEGLARFTATHLTDAIRVAGGAVLAVSGGRTPTRFFEALSAADIAWDRVTVTLVDERWVGEESERSNARLVRAHLLKGPAAAARFLPLYTGDLTPEDGIAALSAELAALPLPIAVAVLGMGDDGHTASFFPGGAGLAHALDPEDGAVLAAVRSDAAGEPRITFTLPPLLASAALALHVEGAGKAKVLEKALEPGPEADMPIRAVLRRSPRPVNLFWCP